jgi:hypothetical protein
MPPHVNERIPRLLHVILSTNLHNILNSRPRHKFLDLKVNSRILHLGIPLLDFSFSFKTDLYLSFLASRLAFSSFQNDHLTLLRRSRSQMYEHYNNYRAVLFRMLTDLEFSLQLFYTFYWRVDYRFSISLPISFSLFYCCDNGLRHVNTFINRFLRIPWSLHPSNRLQSGHAALTTS